MAKWDFSVDVDVKQCSRMELEELVQKKELRGLEALRYRAGVITHFLSRLEQRRHKRHLSKGIRVSRRNQWAVVTRVPARSKIKLGSVVSAIDGISTLRSTFDSTRKLLAKCSQVTFRCAPFYQGWVEVRGRGMCYFVLGYGWASYFDESKAPRTRLGLVSLADATLTPSSSSAICLSNSKGERIYLSQPPLLSNDKFKPIIPILDLAALLVVAVAHANGTDDVSACMFKCTPRGTTIVSCGRQHQHASIQATKRRTSSHQRKDKQTQHEDDLQRQVERETPFDLSPLLLTFDNRPHSASSEDIEPPIHVLNRSCEAATGESRFRAVSKIQQDAETPRSSSTRKPARNDAFLFLDGAKQERREAKNTPSVLDTLTALLCCSNTSTDSESSSAPEDYYYYF